MADYTITPIIEEDVHPDVEEIKPYVAVGPTKDLSITVRKETFDNAFLIFTIIFGLALFSNKALVIFSNPNCEVRCKAVSPCLFV